MHYTKKKKWNLIKTSTQQTWLDLIRAGYSVELISDCIIDCENEGMTLEQTMDWLPEHLANNH